MFSQEHIIVLLTVFALTAGLPFFARRQLNKTQQLKLGRGLAVGIFTVLVAWNGIAAWLGHYDWKQDIPFHLCYLMSMILPFVAWRPSQRVHELLYYWILSGTLQANFTPRLSESFPHYDFIYYWVAHSGLLVYIIYATVVYRLYPTFKGILRAFLWVNAFAVFVLAFNLLFDTNYFYLMAKPPTASLLDFFGPWPWYLFVTEGLAIVLFGLSYLPFAYLKRKR